MQHISCLNMYWNSHTTRYSTHCLTLRQIRIALCHRQKNGSRIFQITQHTPKPTENTHRTHLEHSTLFCWQTSKERASHGITHTLHCIKRVTLRTLDTLSLEHSKKDSKSNLLWCVWCADWRSWVWTETRKWREGGRAVVCHAAVGVSQSDLNTSLSWRTALL